jgi:hypothetical protein
VQISDDVATGVGGLFRARYPEMVRLADLLGADDPEDIAQEAFARLIRKHGSLRNPEAALAYVRASVVNLTRNRHRHLRVVRLRTPAGRHEDSSEQVVMLKEDHREVLAALAGLPPRKRGSPGVAPGRSAPASASASATPAPPGPGDYLIQQNPPVTAIVRVKLRIDGQTTWTFVWLGYLKGHRSQGLNLCSVTDGGGFDGTGGCGLAQIPAHQVAVDSGGAGSIRLGVAARQITSVTAQLPGGRSAAGVVVSGRGFPGKVWLVNYPSADNARIVFRDDSGTEIGHLTQTGNPPFPSRPRNGGITVFHYPAGVVDAKPGWMTAYLLRDGKVGFWSSDNVDSVVSGQPASGPPAVGLIGGDYLRGSPLVEFYGYAHESVARVVLRLADGRQYGANTFAAWKGSGLRLWAFSVPTDLFVHVNPRMDVLLGYDAAGRMVWQMRFGSAG